MPDLPRLGNFRRTGQQRRFAIGELAHRLAETRRQRLTLPLFQRGLGIEQIHLAGAADHEHEDDRLGRAWEMRLANGKRIRGFWR